jgi:hypothetical protein
MGPARDPGPGEWTAILDTLESDVAAAELLLQNQPRNTGDPTHPAVVPPQEHWSPPPFAGLLLPELSARAVALVAAQERIIKRLEGAKLNVARQLQAVSSVPGIGDAPAAVYLDVRG